MRARKTRGRRYGNRGGGPGRSETPSYRAVHARARRTIAGQLCALADETCRGRIEAALRVDIPASLLRISKDGAPYYPGLNTEDAYRPLCRSHHGREGALRAAADRSTLIAAAIAADRLGVHGCSGDCRLCAMLLDFEKLSAEILTYEVDLITRQAEQARAAWRPIRARGDTCDRGHRLVDPNLVRAETRKGGRACLACKRAYDRSRPRPDGFDIAAEADRIYAELMT